MKAKYLSKGNKRDELLPLLCCSNSMELVMYFGNDCIASHPLDSELISKPGYVSTLKRRLLKDNEEVLRYADNEPDFLILNFAFSRRKFSYSP